jgi:hypothetical protein
MAYRKVPDKEKKKKDLKQTFAPILRTTNYTLPLWPRTQHTAPNAPSTLIIDDLNAGRNTGCRNGITMGLL